MFYLLLLTYLLLVGVTAIKSMRESITFEAFAAGLALFAGLTTVFEQRVFLEMISLFEADRANGTDKRPLVGVSPLVILVRRVLRELLAADIARPVPVASRRRDVRTSLRQKERQPALQKRPGRR